MGVPLPATVFKLTLKPIKRSVLGAAGDIFLGVRSQKVKVITERLIMRI
jgi:hypothetical protein